LSAVPPHWPADGPYRILQVTDFHNDQGRDLAERTYRDVRTMIRRYNPHFLAVTGDIWCGDDQPAIAPSLRQRDIRFLGSLGTPWAFCWGNHDYIGDFERAENELRAGKNAYMPESDGRGNYRIELHDPNTKPIWQIYFLNSHELGLEPEDVHYLSTQSTTQSLPALVFFHIPLKQYEDARLGEVYTGIAQEEVLYWENDASRLDAIAATESVRACFVGHSHVNDFFCERDGVVLAYGRATGHGGYGADRLEKGAKLITLERDGAFAFETVFPDAEPWGFASFPPR
jgi:predicted MPP superfamily phosphohydrolase